MVRSVLLPLGLLLLVAGCSHGKSDLDETLGQKITRSTCPAVAIPAYTGDVSLFSPEQSRDARALDVTATITNLRTQCDETGSPVRANVTFDVVATRANPRGERDILLPYYWTVLQAGTKILSKQVSNVQVHFADGQLRGQGTAGAAATVDKAAASLPSSVSQRLNRKRKAGDADASIDPMSDPRIRRAVDQANFELLIGFQLTKDQLAYNVSH
ncbi:hypothetical protein FHS31_000572 [Sphingomonas vulcanisoli]|uniref:Lipoprotein n=1 Tax=Sphingomonas vulcanisoli TaxID=1658060 RepID=A0ABX0TS09_9SPHN|nr:hypothetical protein [Sphingomonas vulcanisoli]NIJ06990.1 hypothetical protein [Sphingomonas vulcanisoli]